MKKIAFFSLLLFCFSCGQSPSKILFISNESGTSDIYLMDMDGSNREVIINTDREEWGAVFSSPNRIQFLRNDGKAVHRYEYNLITKEEKKIAQPSECPTKKKHIVFSSFGIQAYVCDGDIYIKNADASVGKNYTKNLDGVCNFLSWSFDGRSVIFSNNATGDYEIYKLNMRTHEIKNLTQTPKANDTYGDLSPDGNFLVFSSNREKTSDPDLYILNIKTREVKNITNNAGYDLIGRWSKDGTAIIYVSYKEKNWDIYRYDLAKETTKRLTTSPSFDGDPRVR
jgi:Tol biopolymer transport system component